MVRPTACRIAERDERDQGAAAEILLIHNSVP